MQYVPVVDKESTPLMPTTPARARRWVKTRRATPFWNKGVWCVRLNDEPSGRETQPVAVGIDPGSKREALVVATERKTLLNVQAQAVTRVKDAVTTRREMRRARRFRKTPYRQCRPNRRRREAFLPPSTKARWQWKLRLLAWLSKMYPLTHIMVEDVAATTKKGARRWNGLFSPLEQGKRFFYAEAARYGNVFPVPAYEVAETRGQLGLKKSGDKMAERWDAHCVDGWTLTRLAFEAGVFEPTDTRLLCVAPIRLHRRQLHMLQSAKGGVRKPYGGTRSCGFTRGSYIAHPRYGTCYVGGTMNGKISLHAITTGKRLTQGARSDDCRHRAYASWRWWRAAAAAHRTSRPHSSHGLSRGSPGRL